MNWLGNWNEKIKILNLAYDASLSIRVIDPHNKDADQQTTNKARTALAELKYVYILGYGFDTNNNERLDLRNHLSTTREAHRTAHSLNKRCFFTNFNNSNRINKAASALFFGDLRSNFDDPWGEHKNDYTYYEKSTRDTYQALELDFFQFEE